MARKEYRVNVYDDDGNLVGRVRYNSILDYWDGRNWYNGGLGKHKGLTKLKDGRYVLIHGTDWQGYKDYARVITADQALYEILKSGNLDLLKTKKYKKLRKLYEQKCTQEDEDNGEKVAEDVSPYDFM